MKKMRREIEDLQDNNLAKVFGIGGVEKHEKYNWAALDDAGRFEMLPKQYLDIDLKYQRQGSMDKVRHIARHFSWPLFGTLIVVEDEDKSKLFVVDGGHRLRAALLRGDINEVPCMVYGRNGMSEEARIFFDAQTVRSAMRAYDRHRAGLVAELPVAVEAEKLVRRHGYKFGVATGEEFKTSAIFTVYRMIERNAKNADITFDILAKVAQGGPIKNNELKGLYYLVGMNPAIDFYSFPLDNMAKAGLPDIERSVTKWKNAVGHGGEKQYAMGMLEIINKGQVKNKVVVPQ